MASDQGGLEPSCSTFPNSTKGATTLLRAYPLPSLTLVVLFPSRVYNLQFASIFSLSLLPDLPKTGNHHQTFHKKTARLTTRTLLFCGSSAERSAACNLPQGSSARRVDPEDSSRQQKPSRHCAA